MREVPSPSGRRLNFNKQWYYTVEEALVPGNGVLRRDSNSSGAAGGEERRPPVKRATLDGKAMARPRFR